MHDAASVRPAFLPAALAMLLAGPGAPAGAAVVRCTDADGRVSYTDGKCPAGTRQSQRLPDLEVPPAPPPAAGLAAPPATPAPAPAAR
ncbi:MAG: hypothetical protein QM586_15295, partial [Xenophilus sp.]